MNSYLQKLFEICCPSTWELLPTRAWLAILSKCVHRLHSISCGSSIFNSQIPGPPSERWYRVPRSRWDAWDDLAFVLISVLSHSTRSACALLYILHRSRACESLDSIGTSGPAVNCCDLHIWTSIALIDAPVSCFAILIGWHTGDGAGIQMYLLPWPKSLIPIGSLGPADYSLLRMLGCSSTIASRNMIKKWNLEYEL